jgi:RNA polymerase-interacting CarD/CdnL/TRCF family regulator
MRKWNAGIDWTPKDLRNCLPTFSATEGISNVVWEQYIGHAPHNVEEHTSPKPKPVNMVVRARQYQEMLRTGVINNRADLARQEKMARARITQVMSLLYLPEEILNFVAQLEDPILI